MFKHTFCAAALIASAPSFATVEMINVLEFGPDNTLFAADSYTGVVHAFNISPATTPAAAPAFNIENIDQLLADAMGTSRDNIRINDLQIHPDSMEAYLAVTRVDGDNYSSAIAVINQAGEVGFVDTDAEHPELKIEQAPAADFEFYRDRYQGRRLSFTDMDFYKGKLYIAGLSNADFASTLWTAGYPFDDSVAASTVEIYHDIHNQRETRAPVRAMAITELNGQDVMLAAYTCTPLVAIPLDDIQDGAHINGKTIAELGYGNTPIDIDIIFNPDFQGGGEPALFVSNKNQMAQVIPLKNIAEAVKGEGITTFDGNFFKRTILGGVEYPMSGLVQTAPLGDSHIATVRRDTENGDLELASFTKGLYMRLSDYQSEYEIPNYSYGEGQEMMQGFHNMLKTDEGYPEYIVQ